MTTLVVGAGGLLGRAVAAEAEQRGEHVVRAVVPWRDPGASVAALDDAFAALALSRNPWRVAWCAGAGVVATPQEDLDAEVSVFRAVLDRWGQRSEAGTERGSLFLASSAGGVYAGSVDPPFSEDTTPVPLRPYGHAKLAMEAAATDFANRTGTSLLVGRISNIYGPGQDLAKGQGLISAICSAYVTGEPLSVFVPLSTTRDYLYVEDCARMIVTGLEQLGGRGSGPVVKVLAGSRGSGTSIAELFEVATRLYGEPPPHTTGDAGRSAGQVADLRFTSRVWPELDDVGRTPLETGMDATMRDVRARSVNTTTDGEAG